jgi:hypothetical protein
MSNEFYVECYLNESSGPTKIAELACERAEGATRALAANLVTMYRAVDADRIDLRLRSASRSDVVNVAAALKDVADAAVRQSWAVAGAKALSGGQAHGFNEEDLAPASWVSQLEGSTVGSAFWQDASWGNNSAPSWELVDGDVVLAEAFYYTTHNAERFSEHFPGQPYVSVMLFDDDHNPTEALETTPDDFLRIVYLAGSHPQDPGGGVALAAEQASRSSRIYWDRNL